MRLLFLSFIPNISMYEKKSVDVRRFQDAGGGAIVTAPSAIA